MFKPSLLLQQKRSGFVELEYYGFIVFCGSDKKIKTIGETYHYPFFHRSCAKPLQASLIEDYETDKYFNLTDEEIALSCGSHTGEKIHTETLKSMLKKADLKESDLKCPIIAPLNNSEKLSTFSTLHNNCSGKHTLMLLLCRQNNWDIKHYLNINHPLQKKIYTKIKALCEVQGELPDTLDGCTAPNFATSLEELAIGFNNLCRTHLTVRNAMMKYPYMVGGRNRLDTHLMEIAPQICAKVGAGGLCSIVNTRTNESLVIKVIDADMKARTIIALEALIQLNWVNIKSINTNLLDDYFDKNIYTETGIKVGEFVPCFDMSVFNRRF